MSRQFLDFEQPIEELNQKIEALRMVGNDNEVNLGDEIVRLQTKCSELTAQVFSNLEPWQVAQMARHPLRPQTTDYIERIFTDFQELHGDRSCSSAPAIIGGLARLNGEPVMVLGHQKGKRTKEKVYRNFGMARPEEYRKALRLMNMAEKFKLPIFTFIDTAGAYPGIGAEERNQSEAIARNLFVMSRLETPIICVVTGEAGSGGALAIGVGDRILMLQFGIYSVISPEGCASILWKDASKASEAARAMRITADKILENKLIDIVVPEPLGGAHRNVDEMAIRLKNILVNELQSLRKMPLDQLVESRYQKFMAMGACD
ncbi:acetyl-CoA carboxylase carboxyltransferase subunit alpha [Legionella longbeachae]|uniref:Acetyl-coenzyme A carboxylase carboxyl transferase subunit alpha n=1 Tax=Legionella longbeachae serogroup 1 (strain NSW150) TaxID=661367 RepID=D3HJ74_LEGLN|nr:acetyl-CoA carboxylase carboxyltransferase subunit alpha [Legionella longbeachae]VEE02963.1 acetyl-CoA carboxylase carboxyl transferase subunit Alpha [Legionella oakridgensis]HBD7398642.1 acetyl-CoA carboxylase carboxyltransferase subunit alpha [Legionella pneumophila]ARM32771.1 acetyl-CoA carboxylase carboxyltransferase subunit alpha [Legionella longbeachae]AVH82764.1 acetyl-CoA carboxylase carboxyltransferase subunit alpha [Legionella longbeachae]EEZ94435.1 acetyl-CoA carboxylase alpha su